MSVINFYLGLIASAIAVRYHRCLPLSLGVERNATEAHGKESKKGRETREREGHRHGGRRFIIPLLLPSRFSLSLRSFRCPARTVKALCRRNITSAISWRPAAHWLIYTVVRMISLEKRVLDVYHRNADTDHRAYRYTRETPTIA